MSDQPANSGAVASPHAEFERLVASDFRRNVTAFVSWEFIWGLGLPFAMYETLVPAYLQQISAPKVLIGIIAAFPTLFAPAAILGAYWVPARKRLQVARWTHILAIVPWWVYSIVAALWGGAWSRSVHYALFALAAAAFMGGIKSIQPVLFDVMTDNTPLKRRGRMLGFRAAALGVSGLGMGYVAIRLLERWPVPQNYRICFVIGTSLFILSCASSWLLRDHVNPSHSSIESASRPSVGDWLKESFNLVWDEPNYRIFLFFQALLRLAVLGSSFIVVAAGDVLGVSAGQQGGFSMIYLGAMGGLGWLIGLLADRYGFRMTEFVVAVLLAVGYILVLVSRSLGLWYLAYGAVAVTGITWFTVLCNMGAEICPDVRPGRLMALGNSLVLLLVVPGMAACGWVVDYSGRYDVVFVTFFVLSLVSALGFACIVKEPRTGRLYMIKPMRRP